MPIFGSLVNKGFNTEVQCSKRVFYNLIRGKNSDWDEVVSQLFWNN